MLTAPPKEPRNALASLVALLPHIAGAATPSVATVAKTAAGSNMLAATRKPTPDHPYSASFLSFSIEIKTWFRKAFACARLEESSTKSR